MSPVMSLRRGRLHPVRFGMGAALLLCLGILPTAEVQAQMPVAPQDVGKLRNAGIDLQVFRPGVDSKGFITLNASQILGPKEFSFGLVSTWARNPLLFEGTVGNQRSTWKLQNLITSSFQGAVGVFSMRQIGLQVGLVVPVSILSGRAEPPDLVMPNNTNDDRDYRFDAQGLGDLVVHPKLRLLNASRNKIGLSLIPSVVIQSGDTNSFFGEGKFIFQPTAVIDTELGRQGRFRAAINVGARLRVGGTSSFTEDAASFPRPVMDMPMNTNQGIQVGNELLAGLGLSFGVLPGKFDIVGRGLFVQRARRQQVAAHRQRAESGHGGGGRDQALPGPQLLLRAGRRLGLRRRVWPGPGRPAVRRLHLRAVDRRPRRRRLQGRRRSVPGRPGGLRRLRGRRRLPRARQRQGRHPRHRRQVPQRSRDPQRRSRTRTAAPTATTNDRDGDGIPDDVDKCPDDPEDKDGFEDEDGCPDPDNDKDGILDVDDLCPNDPEDKDGFEDKDGCPDPDNDKDRILDVNDKCPNEPETYNGFEDEDGCPDKGRVIVARARSRSSTRSTSRRTRPRSSRSPSRCSTPSPPRSRATRSSSSSRSRATPTSAASDDYNLELTEAARAVRAARPRGAGGRARTAAGPRLRREQADLHPAQRDLLEPEPPGRSSSSSAARTRCSSKVARGSSGRTGVGRRAGVVARSAADQPGKPALGTFRRRSRPGRGR